MDLRQLREQCAGNQRQQNPFPRGDGIDPGPQRNEPVIGHPADLGSAAATEVARRDGGTAPGAHLGGHCVERGVKGSRHCA